MSAYSITQGDVVEVLRGFQDNSFDALFCDPPYGFSFMGKAWDYDVPSVECWAECLRVLKPGAPLLAFGGARTYHRLACAIEDAGFELRDCLMWLYGKGFPKSQNISLAIDKSAGATREVVGTRVLTGNAAISTKEKGGTYGIQVGSVPPKTVNVTEPATELARAWEGYGTALKPAYEPVVLARKPLDGTMAQNVERWGVGGLAIDACRLDWIGKPSGWSKTGSEASENVAMSGANYAREAKPDADGRWPANLLLDEDAAALLDAEVGGKGFLNLKPAHEPVVLARKPLDGTMAQNVERWGVGGLAIDACRVGSEGGGTHCSNRDAQGRCLGHRDRNGRLWETIHSAEKKEKLVRPSKTLDDKNVFGPGLGADTQVEPDGRWPANLILDEDAAALIDAEVGNRPSTPFRENTATGNVLPLKKRTAGGYSDGGGPSRFFYTTKVSTKEREAGCEYLPLRSAGEVPERDDKCKDCVGRGWINDGGVLSKDPGFECPTCLGNGRVRTAGLDDPLAGAGRRGGARNSHPTLKPISLTTYLARLIMPPTSGVILIPFAGSGSEMIGAIKAGWSGVFGIEREDEYVRIARARLAYWCPGSEAA